MALQVATSPRAAQATLKVRESVTQLSDEVLKRFRSAVDEMLKRPDNWGYQFFAGWHWVPFWLCEHHNDLFLPWHRGYLYHFELGLQDIDPEVTVPWWNWMDEPDLPAAFNEPEVDGEPNVLFDAPVEPYGLERQPGWPERTFRQPGAPHTPKPLGPPLRGTTFPSQSQDAYDWMMSATSYSEFESRCWRVHDNIHDWVGGTMADQNWAAYDPIFWAHHAMVDRLWRIWQHNNPAAAPPNLDHAMSFARAPALKVHEVLDVKQLGYEYAGQADTVEGTVPSG